MSKQAGQQAAPQPGLPGVPQPAHVAATLADLVATYAVNPTGYTGKLYLQRATTTGAAGATLGSVLLAPTTDADDVETEIALRLGCAGECLARMKRLDGNPGGSFTAYVHVVVDGAHPALQGGAAASPVVAPVAAPPTEAAQLRAELAILKGELSAARAPQTHALVQADPFAVAERMMSMVNSAVGAAVARQPAAAPPSSIAGPSDHAFWMGLGEKMSGSSSWVQAVPAIVTALSPAVERVVGVAEKLVAVRATEADARLTAAAAAARSKGVELTVVADDDDESAAG